MNLAKKLKLKGDTEVIALNAPYDIAQALAPLPEGVTVKTALTKANVFILLFVKNKAELDRKFLKTVKLLKPGGLIWIAYPKTTSGMQTDLSRDKGWDVIEQVDMQWLALISFDDNWSAFLMRNEPQKKQSKPSEDYQNLVARYVDVKNKTVILPDDLQAAFAKDRKAAAFYESLAYSNRKEYVIWIVSAKQEATRRERISKAIGKLNEGKKNPSEK